MEVRDLPRSQKELDLFKVATDMNAKEQRKAIKRHYKKNVEKQLYKKARAEWKENKKKKKQKEKMAGIQRPVPNVLYARTALLMDFYLETPEVDPSNWADLLLLRTIPDRKTGRDIPIWKRHNKLPTEVAELAPEFRKRLGWRRTKDKHAIPTYNESDGDEVWRSKTLRVTGQAKKILFPKGTAQLWAMQPRSDGLDSDTSTSTTSSSEKLFDDIIQEIVIKSVKVVLSPLGTGLLIIDFDWSTPSSSAPMQLNSLATWLFLAKFRHHVENVLRGWTFPQKEAQPPNETLSPLQQERYAMHRESLGKLARAIYDETPISLSSIGNWLVHLHGENPSSPPIRIDRGQRCHLHTAVVLTRKPSQAILHKYLYHFMRAYGQTNRPPPFATKGPDKILIQRRNRYVGLSAEGTVCIDWPTKSSREFDIHVWPKLFFGIYLVLAQQVHAERVVLYELSNLASKKSNILKLDTELSLKDMEMNRLELKALATMMVYYTISMSTDECGGRSEYFQFFSCMRKVFRIKEAKNEVRKKIDDLLAIVESGYREEQRKSRIVEMLIDIETEAKEMEYNLKKETQKKVFDIFRSTLLAFIVPISIVGAVVGSNCDGVEDIQFWPSVGSGLALSFILLCIIFIIYDFLFTNWMVRMWRKTMSVVLLENNKKHK